MKMNAITVAQVWRCNINNCIEYQSSIRLDVFVCCISSCMIDVYEIPPLTTNNMRPRNWSQSLNIDSGQSDGCVGGEVVDS